MLSVRLRRSLNTTRSCVVVDSQEGSLTARSYSAAALYLAVALLACSDATGPNRNAAAVDLVFLDGAAQLNTLHSGELPAATPVRNVVPFASLDRAALILTDAGVNRYAQSLNLFHLDGRVDSLAISLPAVTTAGAVSPDGTVLAFASVGTGSQVFIHTVDIATGARDSLDVTSRQDALAAPQIIFSTPIFSPSGDSVVFLLPNDITVQVFLYEVPTQRIEVFPVPVPVTTYVRLLTGWPRWTKDGEIRFLTRRFVGDTPTDTLLVMAVDPRERRLNAHVLFRAATPDSLPIEQIAIYSFDRSGDVVAFAMKSKGVRGLFAMRRGATEMQSLLYDRSVIPSSPLVVP